VFQSEPERNETLLSGETLVEGLTLDEEVHGKDGPLGASCSNPTPGPIPQAAFVKGVIELGFTQGDYNSGDMENETSIFQQTISGGRRADVPVASSYLFNNQNTVDRHYPNLTIIVRPSCCLMTTNPK
jgi:hypothetical protein